MIWYLVIAITFTSVFVAEIGDKSQLMTISLSSKYDRKSVFIGTFSGVGLLTLLAVAVGSIVFQFAPIIYVKLIASAIFILFGIHVLFFQKEEEVDIEEGDRSPLATSFILSFLAEFGDKTQLVVIALSGRYGSPILVLIGALAGMGTIIGIGVLLGEKIGEVFESEKIDLVAGALFIILGAVFLIEALFFG